jgi:hypothetical protein
VLASRYHEVVLDRVYRGATQLHQALGELVEAAAKVLELGEPQRQRTILRVDAGGGTLGQVNWALKQGYHYHGKDYSGVRVKKLVATVTKWVEDPKSAGRQVGWVETPSELYVREVRRIAVRCPKSGQQWGYGVIVSSLSPAEVLALEGHVQPACATEEEELLAYVHFYDRRGGGVETANRDDKQGLGLAKRNKRRLQAQQMVVLLSSLAHNVLVWARRALTRSYPKLADYGLQRLVRDVLTISGWMLLDATGHLSHLLLNRRAPAAERLADALRVLLQPAPITVNLGEI